MSEPSDTHASTSTAGRRALVIGASSGIGAACTKELVGRGFQVAAIARRQDKLKELAGEFSPGSVRPYVHDVCNRAEIPSLCTQIIDDLGGLDMVIYATGVMPKITPETFDTDKDHQVLEINLMGAVAWLNEVAPFFRKQKRGAIVGISSIAGDRGRTGYPVYNTSKAGLNCYLEALRNRLSRHGVTVTTIKPGFVDTVMTKGMKGLFWVASPETAARQIVTAGLKGKNTRYVLRRWGLVGLVIRNIPSFIFRRTNI